jgi:hypothetical protein
MENALAIYQKVDDPLAFCERLAKPFAALVGCSLDQGPAIALTCLCEGITPLEFQRRYHVIQGKPAMRADAMLAEFRSRGGRHVVVERSPERAAIELIDKHGQKIAAEYTWTEAEQSRWPWRDASDHKKGLKDNWSTPTDRRNMLWARLVSDSIRAIAPEIVAGIYTPEEVIDAAVVESNGQAAQQHPQQSGRSGMDVICEAAAAAAETTTEQPTETVIDVQPEPARESTTLLATTSQVAKILELYGTLGISKEIQEATLAKRKAGSLRSLERSDAQQIIDKLESLARQKVAAEQAKN